MTPPSALPRADINVTPMMDVMLVVLMIFMVVVPAIDAAVALPPSRNADARPPEPEEIVLQIDRQGRFHVITSDAWGPSPWISSDVLTLDQVARRLTRLYESRTRDRILYIKADRELRFGVVEGAIAIARRAGVRVVAAVTERKAGREESMSVR